ncbi:glycosyltransferase WbuB [Vibrio sp. 10N.222.52.B12]|uniref:glycosyltransferase family 4 protein n=1 Tax=Vibrio sp. 10N.222.52.B12 TaxID=1880840 RepID=UPI000C83433C|nr:glycosyltransferase family 4 protein [Vibrio sp. 10N.222.52.B12]PMO41086.1 glycosyltransferase WbuB [Vibrio sp. 10N.222.52.B12]
MRLALIIDDYLPRSTRVGAKMFHELACHYAALGHDVTVITPEQGQQTKLVKSVIDNVKVWRFSSGAIKDVPKIKRAVNETLLSTRAWNAISHEVKPDTFDGIVYYSPSIFFGGLVSKIKVRCQCKAYLVLRDLFPQWVIDAGMIKQGSLIERYFRFFEKLSYEQADTIGLMSEKNQLLFNEITEHRYTSEILRNWAELTPHTLSSQKDSIRCQLNLEDKVIYFYGGNIGHAQNMANLIRLARAMSSYKKAHFLFVGQGDEVNLIKRLAKEWRLDNFTYLPSVDQKEFKNLLADIDVGLFSLSAQHTAHNFPGKLLGYMVQSIPILGSVNIGNDLLDIINDNNAGMISVNGEDDVLYKNALSLYENVELRAQIGCKAYSLLEQEFSVQAAGASIIEALKE